MNRCDYYEHSGKFRNSKKRYFVFVTVVCVSMKFLAFYVGLFASDQDTQFYSLVFWLGLNKYFRKYTFLPGLCYF